MFTDELRDMFPDIVQVTSQGPPDPYGNTTPGAVRNLPARVIGKVRTVQDSGGNERMSSVQALFPEPYGLTTEDEYLLPERFVPRNPKAISVGHGTDENGASHERVYFYWTQVG